MFPRFVYKGYRIAREDMVAFKKDLGFIHCIRGYSLEVPVSVSFIVVNGVYLDGTSKAFFWIFGVSSVFNLARKIFCHK